MHMVHHVNYGINRSFPSHNGRRVEHRCGKLEITGDWDSHEFHVTIRQAISDTISEVGWQLTGYAPAAQTMTDEHDQFLEDLRASGKVNMFESPPLLAEAFGLSQNDASAIFMEWTQRYNEQHPEHAVAAARAQGEADGLAGMERKAPHQLDQAAAYDDGYVRGFNSRKRPRTICCRNEHAASWLVDILCHAGHGDAYHRGSIVYVKLSNNENQTAHAAIEVAITTDPTI